MPETLNEKDVANRICPFSAGVLAFPKAPERSNLSIVKGKETMQEVEIAVQFQYSGCIKERCMLFDCVSGVCVFRSIDNSLKIILDKK